MIWFANSQGRVIQVLLNEEAVQAYATLFPNAIYFFAELTVD